jgi:hypothetical protein
MFNCTVKYLFLVNICFKVPKDTAVEFSLKCYPYCETANGNAEGTFNEILKKVFDTIHLYRFQMKVIIS